MTTNYTYGLLDIMGDGAMLGQSGSLTVSFRLTEPECYSLSPEDIDRRNLVGGSLPLSTRRELCA